MRRTTKKSVKKLNNQIVENLFCIPATKSAEDMTLLELKECVGDALKNDDGDSEPVSIQPVLEGYCENERLGAPAQRRIGF